MQLSREGQVLGALTVANHGLSKDLIMSSFFCIYFLWRFLFIYFVLHWVFVSGTGMRISLVAAREGYSSLQRTLLLVLASSVVEPRL